jgi:hypothetical protein
MIYRCDIGGGQQLYLENQGNQTLITLSSSGAGQQQSQRSSATTGAWSAPPAIFRTPHGVVLRVETSTGNHFFQVQAQQIGNLSVPPPLRDAEVLPMHQQADAPGFTPMEPMKPMEPMEPMKPMEPMQMQMGNMQMQMGEHRKPPPPPPHQPSASSAAPGHHPVEAPAPAGTFTREQIEQALDSLDMRISMGEISEETYHRLVQKWQQKLRDLGE